MAVHLLERLHRDAGLMHVHDEKGQAGMLGLVPVGARQQQSEVGLLRPRSPELLAVDHIVVALAIGAGDRPGGVRPAAGLAEELAPGFFAGHAGTQKPFLLLIGAVRQDGRGRQHANANPGHAHRTDALEFFFDDRLQPDRQAAAVPFGRPVRRAPAGVHQLVAPVDQAAVGVPVGFEPGAHFGAH